LRVVVKPGVLDRVLELLARHRAAEPKLDFGEGQLHVRLFDTTELRQLSLHLACAAPRSACRARAARPGFRP
jgi:hypothetical protein